MNNKKNIPTSTLLLIVSGMVAVLLIVLSVVKFNHMNETSKTIEQVSATLESNISRLSKLKTLEKVKPDLERAVDILSLTIPDQPNESSLMELINSLSVDNQTEFARVEFSEIKQNNNLNEIPLRLSFSGKYASLIDLLSQLKNGNRLIRIDEIIISKSDSAINDIKADITAVAFCK